MRRMMACLLFCTTLSFSKSSELPNFPFIFIDEKAERECEPNIA